MPFLGLNGDPIIFVLLSALLVLVMDYFDRVFPSCLALVQDMVANPPKLILTIIMIMFVIKLLLSIWLAVLACYILSLCLADIKFVSA